MKLVKGGFRKLLMSGAAIGLLTTGFLLQSCSGSDQEEMDEPVAEDISDQDSEASGLENNEGSAAADESLTNATNPGVDGEIQGDPSLDGSNLGSGSAAEMPNNGADELLGSPDISADPEPTPEPTLNNDYSNNNSYADNSAPAPRRQRSFHQVDMSPITGDSYTIAPGDTLSAIAVRKYGTGNSGMYVLIAQHNSSISSPDKIYPGTVISFPPMNGGSSVSAPEPEAPVQAEAPMQAEAPAADQGVEAPAADQGVEAPAADQGVEATSQGQQQ